MIKIRECVFETNSSSVHTLTVKSKSVSDKEIYNNNVLDLDKFYHKGEGYTSDPYTGGEYNDYSNGTVWNAFTRHEKAALLFLYLNEESWAIDEVHKKYFTDYVKEILGYTIIKNDGNYRLSCDEDRGKLDIDMEKLIYSNVELPEQLKILDEFIDVINDDTKIITVREGDN